MFQSAPLTKARGDAILPCTSPIIVKVSIRSPHQSKGRRGRLRLLLWILCVSIRSPHQSKGRRPVPRRRRPPSTEFQSAPLTKARGDRGGRSAHAPVSRFNPLPSPKQGETVGEKRQVIYIQVSIRSPHQSKGRLLYGRSLRLDLLVSIRSPHQSKGRQRLVVPYAPGQRFQSAPLTKARGDCYMEGASVLTFLFQSAPLTKARGDSD